ncbi:DUF6313 family protein [Pseudonocardia acaciae]|uniref:DUF6313 family protein n=1 Tax=Pseudonocardia acaciae TaxID=551276 RepID=UPI003CCB8FDF
MLRRGLPLSAPLAILFVAGGHYLGWATAFDVLIQITSPSSTSVPALAYVLSITGWLLVPGLVGAVTGYFVSNSVTSRRQTPLAKAFPPPGDANG